MICFHPQTEICHLKTEYFTLTDDSPLSYNIRWKDVFSTEFKNKTFENEKTLISRKHL